jgi:hypothetical protein
MLFSMSKPSRTNEAAEEKRKRVKRVKKSFISERHTKETAVRVIHPPHQRLHLASTPALVIALTAATRCGGP